MTQLRNTAWIELQARQARLLVEQGRAGEAQQLLARTEAALGNQLDDPQLLAALAGAHADAGNTPRALTLAQRLVTGATPEYRRPPAGRSAVSPTATVATSARRTMWTWDSRCTGAAAAPGRR
ncbi:hypothetical protein [Xanthomonas campestris]|uniref:hypothetical protein n=1 Tax=Xanthomonas campestris TaxID=339 RepID=UPI002162EDBD|nr:hypothetical protein [Xanthomonas campestris]